MCPPHCSVGVELGCEQGREFVRDRLGIVAFDFQDDFLSVLDGGLQNGDEAVGITDRSIDIRDGHMVTRGPGRFNKMHRRVGMQAYPRTDDDCSLCLRQLGPLARGRV